MGYKFEVIPADIDEKSIRRKKPGDLVLKLAHAKATAILSRIPKEKALLITSDQVVVCRGIIREKPVNAEEVFSLFRIYGEEPATTVTGVVVTDVMSRTRMSGVDKATIYFKRVPHRIVEMYLATKNPFLHAGGFDHRHHMINPYVRKIEGELDSIIGLPPELTKRLMNVFLR